MGTVDREFEQLVTAFLDANPGLACQWRTVGSRLAGARRDLVCDEGTSREVFVTIRPDEIVVGTRHCHDDYQDFSAGQSDAEIARDAFARFVKLLHENGQLDRVR